MGRNDASARITERQTCYKGFKIFVQAVIALNCEADTAFENVILKALTHTRSNVRQHLKH
jgi:hypothetical protein